MKKFFGLLIVFPVLLVSCGLLGNGNVATETFWVTNFETGAREQIEAELLAQSRHVNIWAEKDSGISRGTAQDIARFYDTLVYGRLVREFGLDNIFSEYEDDYFHIMDLADYSFGNGDGRLCILFHNIADGGSDYSFVAGYFWSGDFFNVATSNNRDIIYINIHRNHMPGSRASNKTIAHEVQHMMNWVASWEFRMFGESPDFMDLWIDEGLSAAAEWIVFNAPSDWKLTWFNQDRTELISQGNNFFVWGNREGTGAGNHHSAILDDYATVYLFFQWLRLQAGIGNSGNNKIFADIIQSPDSNHWAVVEAADKRIGDGDEYAGDDGWDLLLRDWLAANFINAPTGRWGYRDAPAYRDIQARPIVSTSPTVSLFPGEGVFSLTPNAITFPTMNAGVGGNIRYAGLRRTGAPDLSDDSIFAGTGNALLSFNVSTDVSYHPTTGAPIATATTATITGFAPTIASLSEARFADDLLAGPFPISGRHMLRQNMRNSDFLEIDRSLNRRSAVNE